MSTIVLRSVKGSGLTNNEIDANFTNLNTDKVEAAQTVALTNKTLALGSNTISGTLAQFNTAVTDADLASLAGTETLTNKTLTAPVLANPSYSGTTANGGTVTTIDINGGTIDGAVIGGSSAAAGSFTTVSASGSVSMTATNPGLLFTSSNFQVYKLSNDIRVYTEGVDRAIFNSTGLAVTGALSTTGDILSGGSNASVSVFARGANSGTNGGAALLAQVGPTGSATTVIAIGNKSNLLGGAYSATPYIYGASTIETGVGLAVGGALSCTGNTTLGDAAGDTLNVANGSLLLDASGNLGLGVTPSAWAANFTALQLKNGSALWNPYSGTGVVLSSNTYYGASGERYIGSADPAAMYRQLSGVHSWFTAPSGTAGNAITFTQVLAVEKDKSLSLQGATSVTGCGISFPATQVASSNANTLDDYEEGTWTPTQGAGLTVVGTFSSSGTYTKVGRLVTIEFTVTGSTSLAILSDQLLTANLPFTAGGGSSVGGLRNANNSIAQGVQISSTSVYITGPNIAATPSLTASATYFV